MTQLSFLPPPAPLDRAAALERLRGLVGADLRPLADELKVTVHRDGRRNKGWAGQVVERWLGLPSNGRQEADFGDWELKVVPLDRAADGTPRVRETMAVTMFTAADLEAQPFTDSHLLHKLGRLIVVARTFEPPDDTRSLVAAAVAFDLSDLALYRAVEQDYEDLRWTVRREGLHALQAAQGHLVQPRPKGEGYTAGHFAFYARKRLVAFMLGLIDDWRG